MSTFDDLLELQEHDTTIEQLRHRLATLPERAARDAHLESIGAHERATAEVQAHRDELAREQKRIEDEVAIVEDKVAGVDKTLYSGSVTSPRELQALQDDLESLRRRQRQLEDGVIEVMEQVEPVDADLEARAGVRAELDRRGAELELAVAEAEGSISAELAGVEDERSKLAAAIDPPLLERYDALRRQLGGIAVARLVGSNCGGCHLTLPAVEIDRIKHEPADAWVFCVECGRLLVR
jgi:uncharacterized protein